VLPIERRTSWEDAKDFARALSEALARRDEEGYVLTSTKAHRRGRIFLDYLRNGRGATAIASYSTRARPGATVATPISWQELSPALDPASFTVESIPRRIARRRADPWEGFFDLRQVLTKARREAVSEL
jgi:bifunctional non-homologous end joining protein LigD